jgi:hypothetical protein
MYKKGISRTSARTDNAIVQIKKPMEGILRSLCIAHLHAINIRWYTVQVERDKKPLLQVVNMSADVHICA